jgi:hypothetical protein
MIKRISPIPCFASERVLLLSLKFLFGFLQTRKESKRESREPPPPRSRPLCERIQEIPSLDGE